MNYIYIMLSLLKLGLYVAGLIYNSSYDVINGTLYPNHTDYITFTEKYNKNTISIII